MVLRGEKLSGFGHLIRRPETRVTRAEKLFGRQKPQAEPDKIVIEKAGILHANFLMNSSFATIGAANPWPRFQTLLGLGTGRKPTSYKHIRGGANLSKGLQLRTPYIGDG